MSAPVEPTPDSIVEKGRIRTGYFRAPFRDMNLLDADLFGGRAMRWARWMRLKEWVGYGIAHPEWYVSMIIQDSKYLASSAIYAFHRRTGRLFEHSCARFDRSAKVAPTPWGGECRLEGPGYKMSFTHRLGEGRHRLELDLAETPRAPAMRGSLTLHQDLSRIEPLVVSAPVRPRHCMYTHKAPMPVEGELTVGSDRIVFEAGRDLANLDEHKAFYPYHTRWRWMTFAARDAGGRLLGVNLSDHMMQDEENLNENCAWFDGKLALLGGARFEFDPADPMRPWDITERHGRVGLKFIPEGRKLEDKNFGLARIHYYQLCGRFHGFLVDASGSRHRVSDVYGVCEKMDTHF